MRHNNKNATARGRRVQAKGQATAPTAACHVLLNNANKQDRRQAIIYHGPKALDDATTATTTRTRTRTTTRISKKTRERRRQQQDSSTRTHND